MKILALPVIAIPLAGEPQLEHSGMMGVERNTKLMSRFDRLKLEVRCTNQT